MALLTCAGSPVLRGAITFRRTGAWSAELDVDAPAALSGAVAVAADGMNLGGFAVRSGNYHGTTRALLVGGAGGLNAPLGPKSFRNVALRVPLAEALSASGERLAPGVSLGLQVPFWVRAATSVGAELNAIAEASQGVWRTLDDGSIWLGAETWPTASTLLDDRSADDAIGIRTYWPSDLALRPGTLIAGARASVVVYRFEAAEVIADVYFES